MRTDYLAKRGLLARNIPKQALLYPRVPASSGITVTRDGPGNWYVPQSSADFVQLGLAAPDYLWLCQEASGNLASTIGSLTLTAGASGHLYQQSVTGWTRKFVGLDGATVGQNWTTTSASLDLALNESYAMIAYASHAAATKTILIAQGANNILRATAATGLVRTLHNNVGADSVQNHADIATARQLCWYRNAATSASGAVTNLESIVGTHNAGALTGQIKGIGPQGATAAISARYTWIAIYKGSNAERDWSAYLTTLRG